MFFSGANYFCSVKIYFPERLPAKRIEELETPPFSLQMCSNNQLPHYFKNL